MFGKGEGKRFGITAVVGVALSFFVGGLLTSAGFNGGQPAGATVPFVQSQPGSVQPVAESPFTALAGKLTPSVVNVTISKVQRMGFGGGDSPFGPFGGFFNQPNSPGRVVQGAGSGVIISPEGYILTNNHVVEGAKEVQVTLSDKSEHKAQVIGRDPLTDLAIVKIKTGDNLPYATVGDSDEMKVGDYVMAIGNPFGLGSTVTSGIVSAKGRVIGAGPYDNFIQTDAPINPGNSGGPLFNMKGEIIGINTAIVASGQGLGFAIPINTAKPLIPQLESKGEVTRGYLGANNQGITPELATAMDLKGSEGALVAGVVRGGAAEKAGIKAGDVIVSFDGKPVRSAQELPAMVAGTAVGREVPVAIVRDGRVHDVTAVIARMNSGENQRAEAEGQDRGKWGFAVRDLDPQTAGQLGLKDDRGVLVVGVEPGSPAQRASVKGEDIILEVNRQNVESAKDFKDKVSKAGDSLLLLLVKNEQGQRYIAVTR